MNSVTNFVRILTVLAFFLVSGVALDATAQTGEAKAPAKQKAPYRLSVKSGDVVGISLRAKDVKLSEIGADLAKKLKVPVFLSAVMEKQVVSVDFSDLPLEPAMQLLAPQVFIDYQVDAGKQQPLGIFLTAHNEPPPSIGAVVPSNTQAMLFEGDTEDGVEPTTEEARKKLEEKPLRITYLNYNLSIRARKQPLMFVVLKIGEELGVPVEVKHDSQAEITTDIVATPWEDAIQRLSPNIRLYVRSDLLRAERRLLRMALMPPTDQVTSVQQ